MSNVFSQLASDLIAWVLKMFLEFVAVKISEIILGSIAAYAEFPFVGLALGIAAAAAAIGAAKALASGHGGKAFAEGGIVHGPVLGLVGEAGTEVISPLGQLLAMIREAVAGVFVGPNMATAAASPERVTGAIRTTPWPSSGSPSSSSRP